LLLFSQRKGIRSLQKAIQRERIDKELRNRLWSGIKATIWDNWSGRDVYGNISQDSLCILKIVETIWMHHFKLPTDTIPGYENGHPQSAYQIIRDRFFNSEWWQAYDFIEFLLKIAPEKWSSELQELTNFLLEAENAAYRIIDNEVVEITNENEIEAIEGALKKSSKSARHHFSRALELISDRTSPDYRNSIKESISAVESVCQTISGNSKATLGDCLKTIKSKTSIHPALESAFLKLYGYTSDSGGIRHALTEESQPPSFSDAKFMLVACSAFSNYLLTKISEKN
jgi:hypothetical protein